MVEKNFLGQDMVFEGCKSCAISNHQISNLIGGYIYDDGFVNITADPEVPIKGFMVVGIKPHVRNLKTLKSEERFQIVEVINKLELCLEHFGYDSVIKFEDGYSSHWREWIIPTSDSIYYNGRIFESDEKSKTKCVLYYERFQALLLQALLKKTITQEEYNCLFTALQTTANIEELVEVVRKVYGENLASVLIELKDLNMNFGRGKNLKNITNYAKKYATLEEKEEVLVFARKVKQYFNENN